MELSLSTPALLFPAISLLLLAYTNRFLVIANLIRSLHDKFKAQPDSSIMGQILNLRKRVILIRNMQGLGILSLLLCVLCMFVLFYGSLVAGKIIFGTSLLLLMASLALSLYEIQISVNALKIHLSDIESYQKAAGEGKKRPSVQKAGPGEV